MCIKQNDHVLEKAELILNRGNGAQGRLPLLALLPVLVTEAKSRHGPAIGFS